MRRRVNDFAVKKSNIYSAFFLIYALPSLRIVFLITAPSTNAIQQQFAVNTIDFIRCPLKRFFLFAHPDAV